MRVFSHSVLAPGADVRITKFQNGMVRFEFEYANAQNGLGKIVVDVTSPRTVKIPDSWKEPTKT